LSQNAITILTKHIIAVITEEDMKKIEIFCCYHNKDRTMLDELKQHLDAFLQQDLITWLDTNICPEYGWKREVNRHLYTANIFLLLVSLDSMATKELKEFLLSKEMVQAVDQHQRGEMLAIPIILLIGFDGMLKASEEQYDWKKGPLAKLDPLPADVASVTSKEDRDKTWSDIGKRIGREAEALKHSWESDPGKWQHEADILNKLHRYGEALADCEEAIRLDSSFAHAYANKGLALNGLKRFEEP
jgi:tetratricopeptide (TPR) repeat protein